MRTPSRWWLNTSVRNYRTTTAFKSAVIVPARTSHLLYHIGQWNILSLLMLNTTNSYFYLPKLTNSCHKDLTCLFSTFFFLFVLIKNVACWSLYHYIELLKWEKYLYHYISLPLKWTYIQNRSNCQSVAKNSILKVFSIHYLFIYEIILAILSIYRVLQMYLHCRTYFSHSNTLLQSLLCSNF